MFFDKPEREATYEQMISDGWVAEQTGEHTVVFSKEMSCNPSQEVHTDSQ